MADRFYGLDRGSNEFTAVSEASSSPSKGVEVCVDLAVSLTREEVLELIEIMKQHIAKGNWPPA